MKLVAHLIGKDLRAVAVGALIWILLMSIEVALQLTGAAARPRPPGRPSLLHLTMLFLPFAEVAVAALIVSIVIHEDPLVDARAFWLTRPIPRGQLFVASWPPSPSRSSRPRSRCSSCCSRGITSRRST